MTSSGVIYQVSGGNSSYVIGKLGVQIRDTGDGVCGGYFGIPVQSCDDSSIIQYNIEGNSLMKFQRTGHQTCKGPVKSYEIAVSRKSLPL